VALRREGYAHHHASRRKCRCVSVSKDLLGLIVKGDQPLHFSGIGSKSFGWPHSLLLVCIFDLAGGQKGATFLLDVRVG